MIFPVEILNLDIVQKYVNIWQSYYRRSCE